MAGIHEGSHDIQILQNLARLPAKAIDLIIKKVSDSKIFDAHGLFCLCSVCTERRDRWLRIPRFLLYYDSGQILVFNTNRRKWEPISLEFFQFGDQRLLNFIATDEGLLCLTTELGEFFVCNPLTKRYRKLPSRPERLFIEDSLLAALRMESQDELRYVIVDIFVDPVSGHFKFLVAMKWFHFRQAALYDSSNNKWSEVADLGPGFRQFLTMPRAKYNGRLYRARLSRDNVFNLVNYNPTNDVWKSIETPDGGAYIPRMMFESNERFFIWTIRADNRQEVLKGRVTKDDRIEVFEVQDLVNNELLLWPRTSEKLGDTYDALYIGIPEGYQNPLNYNLMYVGGKGVVYFVGILRRFCVSRSTFRISVKLMMWDLDGERSIVFARKSWPEEFVSNLKGWSQQPRTFPLWQNFHEFRPNLNFCS